MVFRVESAAVRAERLKRVPLLCAGVHERCVRENDKYSPDIGNTPLTRRQARARHKVSNGHGGLRKPCRTAWWCHRCSEKITAKDKIVYVEVH